ncbi:hypothetical protein BH23PLA1_BH23PLA1_16770 [soil metagenome]
MHASSIENMAKCCRLYVDEAFLRGRDRVLVLDVGGANVNGSYRDVFSDPRVRYLAADLSPDEGVDLVLHDPYHIPVPDGSFDVVISGQTFEHLFMTKALWTEFGGFDEQFRCPGGGLVNLDTYARACSIPGSQLITLLGEGTFHQVHGGVATNTSPHPFEVFHEEFRAIRGRDFERPETASLFLGIVNRHVLPSIAQSALGS